MDLIRKAAGDPRRLGILPAAWHPPTVAHMALAEAALDGGHVDEVLLVLPRRFPHDKDFSGVGLEDRLRLLCAAAERNPRFSVGVSDGGLFTEIAAEARRHYGAAELWFVCGRDAAERVANWDYGHPDAFRRMLDRFGLLVASRGGDYEPPRELASRIKRLTMPAGWDDVSSSEVRERIRSGEAWEHLAPPEIVAMVRTLYGAAKTQTSKA